MNTVILTALGVGGATVFGGAVGLIFRKTTKSFCDAVLSFAAGVMLAAAMLGLILPSLEYGGKYGVFTTVLGIFFGAACVHLLDLLIPVFTRSRRKNGLVSERARRVFLFVMAIALHNLPEGMSIAAPMLSGGARPMRAVLLAAASGIPTILGALIGYSVGAMNGAMLGVSLSFAAGAMLYVVLGELLPEAEQLWRHRLSGFATLAGILLGLALVAGGHIHVH